MTFLRAHQDISWEYLCKILLFSCGIVKAQEEGEECVICYSFVMCYSISKTPKVIMSKKKVKLLHFKSPKPKNDLMTLNFTTLRVSF